MPDETDKSKSEQPEEDEAAGASGNGHQIEQPVTAKQHDAKNVPWWIGHKLQTKQVGEKHGDPEQN